MTRIPFRIAHLVTALVLTTFVASCGLPQVGPNKRQIFKGAVQNEGDAFIVAVNSRVTKATALDLDLGFSKSFLEAGRLGSDTIQPGDTLSLTIWENVDPGLLAGQGRNSTQLQEVQVDGNGFIFVPYAGRIRAAGNSPEAIRRIITQKLAEATLDPQVEVRRVAGNGATVSLVGLVGSQGVYPIERPTRTLSAMLAAAGGVTIKAEIAQITVIRGHHKGRIWFTDLFKDPALDIALRAGDRILVEGDPRSYVALGATGAQSLVQFETQTVTALEALAQVGGLSSVRGDPTGIFVFRDETQKIANKVLGRSDLKGTQRFVYVLNLTEPNGVFEARDFQIRDKDSIFVTEAPFTQWQKTISAITGSAQSANALSNITAN